MKGANSEISYQVFYLAGICPMLQENDGLVKVAANVNFNELCRNQMNT